MKPLFLFYFEQEVTTGGSPLVHRFLARDHAEAFQLWMGSPGIQALPMNALGTLTVTVSPAS